VTVTIRPMSFRVFLLLPFMAGMFNVLSFAPFSWWPLQIVTLAIVFRWILRAPSVRHGALIGWAYGFGWSLSGIYWLYISMHRYGGMPPWMAAAAVALLALFLSTFSALATGCASWFRQRWSPTTAAFLLLIFPSLWMLSEWMRGWMFTGLPWVMSGYAHTVSPLSGFAPLIGVYGISWLSALIAGCLVLLPTKKSAAVLAIAVLGIGYNLQSIQWTEPHGKPISVRLLQGNVPQEIKFDAEQTGATLALYHDMIKAAPADLIATPETSLPLLLNQLPPDYLPRLAAFVQQTGSHVAIGLPIGDEPPHYSNSVMGLAPGASSAPYQYRYNKHHLVPFGEFIPTGFRWFVDMMQIPLGDFTRGLPVQAPFAVKDQWILPNVCFEDLFGEEIAHQLAARHFAHLAQATILLNVSNIAWFGDSTALPQHLQISQMRSLETGRPMLRATNTGATAVIDAKGKVLAQLPNLQRGVLAASVQGMQGMTPYLYYGNTLIVALAFLMLGIASGMHRKTHRNSHGLVKTR
jgi:apolipoprotein N-acyltransferase